MSDNHSAEMLGCHGNPEVQTPHLDKLAGEGMQFKQAYCVNAMCSPCRASVLTGLMPSQHGIHTWIDDRQMDSWPDKWNALAEFETLPEILQANGYQTALVGKYHLGAPFEAQNGFEHWVTFPHGHTRNFWGNTVIENEEQYVYEGHSVDFFTEKAVEYLHNQDSEQPFFLFLSYNGPYGHWPAIKGKARNRFAELYADSPMHSVPREGLSRKAIEKYMQRHDKGGKGLDYSAVLRIPNDLESLRNYYSQMSLVDDGVGQVLAALDAQGLAEDTLVIYTCDHGFSVGQHGFWGHGQATWPANTHRAAYHIPLLLRHTGQLAPSQSSEHLISQLDLFPTILEYACLEYSDSTAAPTPSPSPNTSSSKMDRGGEHMAHSLVPLLQGEITDWQDIIFMEQEETRAVRTNKWLYMQRFDGNTKRALYDELYDLEQDWGERNNVAANPHYATVVQQLREQLAERFAICTTPAYDLWQGGTVKSNSDKPWFWREAWGAEWEPVLS